MLRFLRSPRLKPSLATDRSLAMDAAVLEPRLLFNATPIAAVLPDAAGASDTIDGDSGDFDQAVQLAAVDPGTNAATGDDSSSAGATASEMDSRLELVFVDAGVDDYQTLVNDIRNDTADSELRIYLLDPSDDGIQQITEIVSEQAWAEDRPVDVIHVLSHGRDARLRIGNSIVDSGTLAGYAEQLTAWRQHLSGDADVLLYGCDLAKSDEGRFLVEAIAELTGADVAASDDASGSAAEGGDWQLEVATGTVESTFLLRDSSITDWHGLLAATELLSTDEKLISVPVPKIQELTAPHQSVAVDGAGRSVVVWTDHFIDGDGTAIAMRRYDASGNPIGYVEQVNVDVSGNQLSAVVAADSTGRFAVAWLSADAFGTGIYLRRFDAAGNPIDSGNILVNAGHENGVQSNVTIAANDNDQIVLAWESTIANEGIFARTIDFTTALPGGELNTPLLTVDTVAGATNPAVDLNAAGRFVVTWNDASTLWARKYDFGTTTAVAPKLALDSGSGLNRDSAVAVLPNNDYVMVYRSDALLVSGIWGRKVFEDDSMTAATRLSGLSLSAAAPAIAMDGAGDFVVTYADFDGDQSGVYYRAFDSDLSALTTVQRVNQSTSGVQNNASVAIHDSENIVIVWSGAGDQSGNNDDQGIYLRQYGTQANDAPIARADNGTSYSVAQGGSLTLDGTASSDADGDTLSFAWDLDNDGNFGETSEPTTATATVGWSTLTSFGIDATGTYTISLQVRDGHGGVSTATATVQVTNVQPTVTGASQTIAYTEGDTSVDLGDIVVSDPFGDEVFTVTLINAQAATGAFSTGTYGSATSTYDAVSGRWQIVGAAADVNSALASFVFLPAANNDEDTTVTVKVRDSGGIGPSDATIHLNVTAVNDAPRLDLDGDDSSGAGGANYQTTFTEGGGPVSVVDVADAMLEDIDNATLTGLTIEIQNPLDGDAEVLSADTSGTGLTATFSGSTLTLTGTDTVTAYQRVLRTIRYDNTSSAPDTTTRTITMIANDGQTVSNVAQTAVTISAANQAPVLVHPNVIRGGENAVTVISGVSVNDSDLGSGNLHFVLTVDHGVLTLDTTVAAGIDASQVLNNGSSSVTLIAPINAINNTLASGSGLVYQPDAEFYGNDTLTLRASDSVVTTSATAAIEVVENASPVARDDRYSVLLDESLSVTFNGLLANDNEPENQAMSVVLVSAPASGTLTLRNDGSFRFVPATTSPEVVTFAYAVTDGINTSDPAVVTIRVEQPITAADIQSSVASTVQEAPDTNETTSDAEAKSETQTEDSQQSQEETLAPITEAVKDAITRNEVSNRINREAVERTENDSVSTTGTGQASSQRSEAESEIYQENITLQNDGVSGGGQQRRGPLRQTTANLSVTSFTSQLVWSDFVELHEQIAEVTESPYVFAGQFAGVTSALSVGYVLWTIRSGLLATSLLAHLPAWTVVDPLLVLTDLDADDEDEDDESLEGMLGHDKRDGTQDKNENSNSQQESTRLGEQDSCRG